MPRSEDDTYISSDFIAYKSDALTFCGAINYAILQCEVVMKKSLFVIIVFVCFCVSCSGQKENSNEFFLEGDNQIAAEVEGEPISRFDVEEAAIKTLGKERALSMDEALERKILESLVTSRAMATAQWKVMSEEEKARTNKEVAAFKEQLLVRKYLADNASPSPITEEKLKRWYESHPDRYGAREIISYEMVAGVTRGDTRKSESWMTLMTEVRASKTWRDAVTAKREEGWPLLYRKGIARKEVMDKTLFQLIASVSAGNTSPLTYVQGNPYVVRVTEKRMSEPRPFNEVRAEIRQSLGPLRMKEAVKEAGTKALAGVEVVYK